jgi:Mg-chelatase subunit ChlD
MKDKLTGPFDPETNEEKITALILGELKPSEAAAWERRLQDDPAVQALFQRLKATAGLVRDAVRTEAAESSERPAPLQLSPERRQALLDRFKQPSVPQEVRSQFHPAGLRWLLPLALAACFLIFMGLWTFSSLRMSRQMARLASAPANEREWAGEHFGRHSESAEIPLYDDLDVTGLGGTTPAIPGKISGKRSSESLSEGMFSPDGPRVLKGAKTTPSSATAKPQSWWYATPLEPSASANGNFNGVTSAENEEKLPKSAATVENDREQSRLAGISERRLSESRLAAAKDVEKSVGTSSGSFVASFGNDGDSVVPPAPAPAQNRSRLYPPEAAAAEGRASQVVANSGLALPTTTPPSQPAPLSLGFEGGQASRQPGLAHGRNLAGVELPPSLAKASAPEKPMGATEGLTGTKVEDSKFRRIDPDSNGARHESAESPLGNRVGSGANRPVTSFPTPMLEPAVIPPLPARQVPLFHDASPDQGIKGQPGATAPTEGKNNQAAQFEYFARQKAGKGLGPQETDFEQNSQLPGGGSLSDGDKAIVPATGSPLTTSGNISGPLSLGDMTKSPANSGRLFVTNASTYVGVSLAGGAQFGIGGGSFGGGRFGGRLGAEGISNFQTFDSGRANSGGGILLGPQGPFQLNRENSLNKGLLAGIPDSDQGKPNSGEIGGSSKFGAQVNLGDLPLLGRLFNSEEKKSPLGAAPVGEVSARTPSQGTDSRLDGRETDRLQSMQVKREDNALNRTGNRRGEPEEKPPGSSQTAALAARKENESLAQTKKDESPGADGFVSEVVKLQHAKPSEVAEALRPLATSTNGILDLNGNGMVVLRGFPQNVKSMLDVVEKMEAVPESEPASKLPNRKPAVASKPLPEILTALNPFSTFSLNVSDVAFKLAAASLANGQMPEPAGVRSEEFVNALHYHDPAPLPGEKLAFAWEQAHNPFEHNRDFIRLSIQTAAWGREPGRPLNLVLLLDNSGSMERADRVQIVRQALTVLARQLTAADRISVVAFARTARLWVDGLAGGDPEALVRQVDNLNPQGGTNLELALDLAYAIAQKHFLTNGNNRVILLTDGAANLGNVNPAALKQKVESWRRKSVALDCFGVGWEGYNDDLLEVLSRNGDGRYGFLNNPAAAANDFAGQLAGALRVAASDVKAQVEFNPERVVAYRQIGYEKHQLTKEQFRDNTVDAAEIGAAESGTVLYSIEVNPQGTGPLGTARVRFKVPGTGRYKEREWLLPFDPAVPSLDQAYPSMRLAAVAAAFAEWLARSPYAGNVTLPALQSYLNGVPETFSLDAGPRQLASMLQRARMISGQ